VLGFRLVEQFILCYFILVVKLLMVGCLLRNHQNKVLADIKQTVYYYSNES